MAHDVEYPVLNQTCKVASMIWLHDETTFGINTFDWKVSNDKYMWQFESNLQDINVDDKPVALGLAWSWPLS